VYDWNNDGRKDLLVGQEGISAPCNVFVYLNQGTSAEPVFADSVPVLNSGSPINSYRSVPVMEDLDRDGKRDLVLGEWYSSVRFYRNLGTNASPYFASYVYLVEPDPDSFLNGNPPRVNFTDWDGDGDRDMITCDYYGSVFLRRNITPSGVSEERSGSLNSPRLSASPNPFLGRTRFTVHLSRAGDAVLRVLDGSGRTVRTIAGRMGNAGTQVWTWDGDDASGRAVPAGTYFAVLSSGGAHAVCQVVRTE
jgi:hypothetical protein